MFAFKLPRNDLTMMLLVLGVAALATILLGFLTWATSVYLTLGVALVLVGLARLFVPRSPPALNLGIVAAGFALILFQDTLPTMSIAGAIGRT